MELSFVACNPVILVTAVRAATHDTWAATVGCYLDFILSATK